MKRIAILQSNYIPWKGYFDIINRVDEFVLYDDCRYTRRDWRNRNAVKTPEGAQWLTIPVRVPPGEPRIRDVAVADDSWRQRHWRTLQRNYARAPFFAEYRDRFESLYLGGTETRLSWINREFIETINDILGICTPLRWSWEFPLRDGRNERIIDLCRQLGATEYLSGPAAKSYIEPELFQRAGVRLAWMSYEGYPEYPQLFGPFEHCVSALDLIFNCGPACARYMLRFDNQSTPAGVPEEACYV